MNDASNTSVNTTASSSNDPNTLLDFRFEHRGREFELRVRPGEYVGLFFNGVPRKERVYAGREPLYLWTNVELEWEEHHYIEARYWPSTGVMQATVNGDALANWQVPTGANNADVAPR